MKVIAYYQTFTTSIRSVADQLEKIIVSSVHFNIPQNTIHLNDDPFPLTPNTYPFNVPQATCIMLGGAGGGFTDLFLEYSLFFPMLIDALSRHERIDEIVLDVEECVSITDVNMLIRDLRSHNYTVSMAPCAFCLLTPTIPGLGGFLYKDIDGGCDTFYVQAYTPDTFNLETYNRIKINFPHKKIVMGCLTSQPLPIPKGLEAIAPWDIGSSQDAVQWVERVLTPPQTYLQKLKRWAMVVGGAWRRKQRAVARFLCEYIPETIVLLVVSYI